MKTICVSTSTRAEYGLLRPLMNLIQADEHLQLIVLVSGAHLSKEFGYTYNEIDENHLRKSKKVVIDLDFNEPVGMARSIGSAIGKYAKALHSMHPDMLIVLGDRFESYALSSAALVLKIPIAHIHGGEVTIGALDDVFRHCISKMSYLHFTSTEVYRKRVIQLGEHPSRVFNVGALGLDVIQNTSLLSKEELTNKYKIQFSKHNLLVTLHPSTMDLENVKQPLFKLLEALDERRNTTVIFTKANADLGGKKINHLITKFVKDRSKKKYYLFDSLGQLGYLSVLQFVDAVVGNSSSGIIEAPSFKVGTINIGDRQKGRLLSKSIINCEFSSEAIQKTFKKLYSPDFQKMLSSVVNPYYQANTALKIKNILKNRVLDVALKKGFFDINIK